MKRGINLFFIAVLVIMLCNLAYACDADQRIMRLSSATNAHGEIYNGVGNYAVEICYDGIFGKTYTEANPHDCTVSNKILELSNTTNAHAGDLSSPYSYQVCYGDLECTIKTEDCGANEELIVSISSNSNAHLASDNSYNIKVCCESTGEVGEEEPSPPPEVYIEDEKKSEYPQTLCMITTNLKGVWRDTMQASENDCRRDGTECCPWGTVCEDFPDEVCRCIYDGETSGCASYNTEEECLDFDYFAAVEDIDSSLGSGTCGTYAGEDSYNSCKCVWSSTKQKCEPKLEKVRIDKDNNITIEVLGTCDLSCDESECSAGIKTVSCTATGDLAGCSDKQFQKSCAIPTEIPFFTLINILTVISIMFVFYTFKVRKK